MITFSIENAIQSVASFLQACNEGNDLYYILKEPSGRAA